MKSVTVVDAQPCESADVGFRPAPQSGTSRSNVFTLEYFTAGLAIPPSPRIPPSDPQLWQNEVMMYVKNRLRLAVGG